MRLQKTNLLWNIVCVAGWFGILFGMLCCLVLPCHGGENQSMEKMQRAFLEQVSVPAWNHLAGEKIFFAHQSVGFNIIDGIREVMRENPQVRLHVVEGHAPELFSRPVFAHSRIGRNTKPETKIREFQKLLLDGLGGKLDIAFLKLCFVDIDGKTDVRKLFDTYKNMVQAVQHQFPRLVLVHFTVPLKTIQTSWKTRLRTLLGGEAWEYTDNIRRNEYNKLITEYYKGKAPVFDIARFESMCGDNESVEFTVQGKTYLAMNPSCSSDGGHLNGKGKKIIAEHLIVLLAGLSNAS